MTPAEMQRRWPMVRFKANVSRRGVRGISAEYDAPGESLPALLGAAAPADQPEADLWRELDHRLQERFGFLAAPTSPTTTE